MNTPQEFEPLGYWMGWEKKTWPPHTDKKIWLSADGVNHEQVTDKISLTDAECIEALNRLVEKGYGYGFAGGAKEGHGMVIMRYGAGDIDTGFLPTINQAIEQALLKLIEAEGKSHEKETRSLS